MQLLITDSGVGGLSVCAYAERYLRTSGSNEAVRLTYVNASPENDFGYNAMKSRNDKIAYFNRFLNIISDTFAPDGIYIACNTLSVLYPDTEFSKNTKITVRGIVETGVDLMLHKLTESRESVITIFGTPTTIEEETYSRRLEHLGIDRKRIISQACHSLADTISEDRRGLMTKKKIQECVDASLKNTKQIEAGHLSYLACTHYGYRKEFFSEAFADKGIATQVINPNEFVVEELFDDFKTDAELIQDKSEIIIEFISRYEIPESALETISFFLEKISPNTVRAFTNYTYAPELF
jgi:glutamate racemase